MVSLRQLMMILVCTVLCACGQAAVLRLGPPLSLPTGAPKGACERAQFYQVVPARVFAEASESQQYGYMIHHTHQEETAGGLALYRDDQAQPVPLDAALPEIDSALAQRHLDPIAPSLARLQRRSAWRRTNLIAGAVALVGAGLIIGGAVTENWNLTYAGAGVAGAGLTVELIALGGVLANRVSVQEQTFTTLRRFLFLPGEDDAGVAQAAVDRHNQDRRRACASR